MHQHENTSPRAATLIHITSVLICCIFMIKAHPIWAVDAADTRSQSMKLVEQALREIEKKNIEKAYRIIQQAVLKDPSNNKAKEILMSLHDLLRKDSGEEGTDHDMANGAVKRRDDSPGNATQTGGGVQKYQRRDDQNGTNRDMTGDKNFLNILDARACLLMTFSYGNYASLDDTFLIMGGVSATCHYFPLLKRHIGFSLEYQGGLLKLEGDRSSGIMTHRVTGALRGRLSVSPYEKRPLILGIQGGYHYFTLSNNKKPGTYYFTAVWGPSLGVFLSDGIIYRFTDIPFFHNLIFEIDAKFCYVIWRDNPPLVIELYGGIAYLFPKIRFHVGYRFYHIGNTKYRELYHSMEIGAGYSF